jgi:quercetin dioxygenase-like cupin family protein
MGYSKTSLADAEKRSRNSDEPAVRALGYEIRDRGEPRPRTLRFNYFHYEEGEAVRRHRQREQEELLFVVEGGVKVEVDSETFTAETDDFLVIDSGSWRQVRALTTTEIFAVGAPNVAGDHVFEDGVYP